MLTNATAIAALLIAFALAVGWLIACIFGRIGRRKP